MLMPYTQPAVAQKYAPLFGVVPVKGGGQFTVFTRSAESVRLLLYDHPDDTEPAEAIELDGDRDRQGDTWNGVVRGIGHGQLYHLQVDGPHDPARGYWFDGEARLIDPYAQALAGDFQPSEDGVIRPPKCVIVEHDFNWDGDQAPKHHLADSVIYEMHVGGFTKSPTAQVEHPGSYLGVIEKIPYLKTLGVTAVELLPVHEFPIRGPDGRRLRRPNYWGYDPMAFFAPHRGYAVDGQPGSQVREFKQMVKALHRAGIEVILDVVFNHTCEGNERGPVLSFKGLENHVYYILDGEGRHYMNYTGCGNTLNCNHPVVRQLILDCLRHWVVNYHVDGFRFDLGTILKRGRDGSLVDNAPLVEAIADDPVLAGTKMIAEPWDAGGAYQVGTFWGTRWAEWNGRYRDDARRFWRGDGGMLGPLATRLAGSSDPYEASGRPPFCSINFVTCHDGFPINDLVSYRHKHNEANGEKNRDGDNNNFNENYGVEGETRREDVNEIRVRQIKNMLATLMLSQGVPMLLAGDECRRTQRGNNNAYCQDNEVSWFDWELVKRNRELVRFCRALVRFRRTQPTVRRRCYLRGDGQGSDGLPDVSWFGPKGQSADWHSDVAALTCLLNAPPQNQEPERVGRDLLLLMNANAKPCEFALPPAAKSHKWRTFMNTASEPPNDIYPSLGGPAPPKTGRLILPGRSMVCYVSDRQAGGTRKRKKS